MKTAIIILIAAVMITVSGTASAEAVTEGLRHSIVLVCGRLAMVEDYMPKDDPPIPLGEHVVYVPFNGMHDNELVKNEIVIRDTNADRR